MWVRGEWTEVPTWRRRPRENSTGIISPNAFGKWSTASQELTLGALLSEGAPPPNNYNRIWKWQRGIVTGRAGHYSQTETWDSHTGPEG